MVTIEFFKYGKFTIRAYRENDKIRFIAKDICKILGLKNCFRELEYIDEDSMYLDMNNVENIHEFPGVLYHARIMAVSADKLYKLYLRARDENVALDLKTFINEHALTFFNTSKEKTIEDRRWQCQQELNYQILEHLERLEAAISRKRA